MNMKKILAAGVHVYTSLGVILAFSGALALKEHDIRQFLIVLWIAAVIDSTDGMMARYVQVKEVLPNFNGRRLDDIIDYITYAFLPSVALVEFNVLPDALTWIAIFPPLASAYGFSQELAKTEETFVGFPSYWNVVFLYLYIFSLPTWMTVAILLGLSCSVFIPIHYIYPSRTRWMKPVTLTFTSIYGILAIPICLFPDTELAKTLTLVSLLYPIYYLIASLIFHRKITSKES